MRMVLVLIFLIVMVVFALENQSQAIVNLGPFAVEESLGIIIIVTFVIGVFIGRSLTVSRDIKDIQKRYTKS